MILIILEALGLVQNPDYLSPNNSVLKVRYSFEGGEEFIGEPVYGSMPLVQPNVDGSGKALLKLTVMPHRDAYSFALGEPLHHDLQVYLTYGGNGWLKEKTWVRQTAGSDSGIPARVEILLHKKPYRPPPRFARAK